MTGVVRVTKSEQPCHSGSGWHGKSAFVHRHSSWIDTIPMKEFYRKSLFDLALFPNTIDITPRLVDYFISVRISAAIAIRLA